MANTYFQFKEFRITQANAAMKVGTDGVLLGAWANYTKPNSILDIGTGTGLIALMLAQRTSAKIIGIDIDENAMLDANENINNSPWVNKVSLIASSLQEFSESHNQAFDYIVSNPPFFENSFKAEAESRTKARHTDSLSTDDLLLHCRKLLTSAGKCAFILPSEQYESYIQIAKKNHLFPERILWVKPTPTKAIRRVLIEFSFTNVHCNEETLIIEEFGRHLYSKKYIELTKNYYLNF